MKTVSSNNSLIFWEQNQNRTNFFPTEGKFFLREDYVNLFDNIAKTLDGKIQTSFVAVWRKTMEKAIQEVGKKLKGRISDEWTAKILNKFRGNCGEIFAEAFFNAGYLAKYCRNDTYEPANPTNERFIDAVGISPVDGLPIGIQVKNYKEFNLVPHEIFMKAAAEDDLWLRHDKRIPQDKVLQYISTPHQFLFSFSDSRELHKENYFNSVVLIGPDEIDAAKLQGDSKIGITGNAMFFRSIVEEINALV